MLTPRETSPYGIMQEKFRDEPWKLLVCCVMLNLTSRKRAEPVWDEFFRRWPTPERLYSAYHGDHVALMEELRELLRPLGLQNRRSQSLWWMTLDYLELRPDRFPPRVGELHGVGKYAEDSFLMFVGGELVLDVQDKELRRYVDWAVGRYAR